MMLPNKLKRNLVAGACAFSALLACGTVLAQGSAPRSGGVMVVAVPNEPNNFMGLNQNRDNQYISTQLFPALLEYGLDLKPKPSLAERWEIAPDGLSYTFHLVPTARWSDGKPITSADVKFSILDMAIKYHPSGKQNFGMISAIDTPDDHTVVFRLARPFSPLIALLGHMTALVLPKHVYEGTDPFQNPNSINPKVTGGPFILQERVAGDHVTLARNPNFMKPGRPYLDKIIFRFISDPSSRVVALEAGEADYIASGGFPANEIDRLKKVPGITVVGSGAEATADVATFGFNLRRAPFDKAVVRRALSHAINREFIQKSVAYGYSPLASGPLHPNSWAFDRQALSGLDYAYDPKLAEKMLDEAGYPRKAGGTRFAMTINSRPALFVYARTNEIIADNLRAIGIDAKIVPLENAAYFQSVYVDWSFDLAGGLFISGYDPQNMAAIYTCEQIRPIPFANFMGY
ncbi:ABC transporter substrate-binding protein, partial [Paracoccus sp. (in: a-proteobacteria)]|uniref:ABC transporter substrate-binding protein n=1 Tax=Paracoccus sp. TaxID=267 RepID=UPI00321FBDC8